MNRTLLMITMALALLLGLGMLSAACSRNDAHQDPEPDVVSENPETEIDRESALAEREAAVAEREMQLAGARTPRVEEPQVRVPDEQPREPEEPIANLPEPAERTVVLRLPAATPIEVEFQDFLSSEVSLVGDRFRVSVVRDVMQEGIVAIPAGSEVLGTVSSVVAQKKIGGQQRLALSFDRIELPSGQSVGIQAFLELEGRSQKKKDAATIGARTSAERKEKERCDRRDPGRCDRNGRRLQERRGSRHPGGGIVRRAAARDPDPCDGRPAERGDRCAAFQSVKLPAVEDQGQPSRFCAARQVALPAGRSIS